MAPAGGGGVRYFIGDFDGHTFTYDDSDPVLWLDYGPDNYAGTTWSDMPADKRTYIGWMSNWQYAANTPTSRWRGATTLPREFHLVRTADGIRMVQAPVAAITQLREPIGIWDNLSVDGEFVLENVQGRRLEIVAEIVPATDSNFGIDVQRGADLKTHIIYNGKQSKLYIARTDKTEAGTISAFTPAFGAPIPLKNVPLRLHIYVDESSVEVFAQDGLFSLTSQTFVNPANIGVSLFTEKGTVKVSHFEIYALKSIWSTNNSDSLKLENFNYCR